MTHNVVDLPGYAYGFLKAYRERVKDWHSAKYEKDRAAFPLMKPTEVVILTSDSACAFFFYATAVDLVQSQEIPVEIFNKVLDAPKDVRTQLLAALAPRQGFSRSPEFFPSGPRLLTGLDPNGQNGGKGAADLDAAILYVGQPDVLVSPEPDGRTRYGDLTLFTGAGASKPCGIPTMKEFVTLFESECDGDVSPDQKDLLSQILASPCGANLEQLLTLLDYLRQADLRNPITIENWLMSHFSHSLAGLSAFEPNTSSNDIARALTEVRAAILKEQNRFIQGIPEAAQKLHRRLIRFIHETCAKIDPRGTKDTYGLLFPALQDLNRNGLDWFTTNYDTTVEYLLQNRPDVDLSTGFDDEGVWANRWRQRPEKYQVRYYKLHGSVTWYRFPDGRVTEVEGGYQGHRYTRYGTQLESMMLYPVTSKMEYRDPYFSLMWHFRECLSNHSRLAIIAGYGLADGLIRDIVINALSYNPRLQVLLVNPCANDLRQSLILDDRAREAEARIIACPATLEGPDTLKKILEVYQSEPQEAFGNSQANG